MKYRAFRGFLVALFGASVVSLVLQAVAMPVTLASRSGRGRVLVDDRLSREWAPSARRLDGAWFGDFSTYSLSALVEFVSHRFAVAVNTGRRYDSGVLESFDALVLKTPTMELEDDEADAILEFVHGGGRLFLIGDHTNLLGSSDRLNRFAQPAGIHFQADAVADARTGGFSYFRRGGSTGDPVSEGVDLLELMTGCSLRVDWSARPLLVAQSQVTNGHDYGGSSYFSRVRSDPDQDIAPVPFAAMGTYGKGVVLAFSDSTILSSFAIATYERKEWFLSALSMLLGARPISGWERLVLLVSSLPLAWGVMHALSRISRIWWLPILGIGWSIGGLAFSWVDRGREPPAAGPGLVEVEVAINGCEAVFSPVLGSVPRDVDMDYSYDTWLAALGRSGVFPRVVGRGGGDLEGVIILNLRTPLDESEVEALRAQIDKGASVWILIRSDRIWNAAVSPLLSAFGFELVGRDAIDGRRAVGIVGGEVLAHETSVIQTRVAPHGRGRVAVTVGSEWFSRERMGHCFEVPDSPGYARYQAVAEVLGWLFPAPGRRETWEILR